MCEVKPSDEWHINCFNTSSVIVIHNGPDEKGHRYVDGRHQHTVMQCNDAADAKRWVDGHNAIRLALD